MTITHSCHPALVAGSGAKKSLNYIIPRPRNKCGVTILFFIALILFSLLSLPSYAQNTQNMVRAELVADRAKISVILHHPEGWHTYYKDAGDAGLPTTLEWKLPEGFSASEIDWPPPQTFSENRLTTYGYSGHVVLPVTIYAPETAQNSTYKISVTAKWLACKDICIPEQQELSIDYKPTAVPALTLRVPQDDKALLLAISLALLGGLVLNLMPCVLPVLSLKALALVKKSGRERAHTARHGVAYTLGILLSFAVIAALLIALQQSGEAVGWGFQMQSPAFVGFLIYLLFLVGLSLSGVFHLPVLLGGVGGNLAGEASLRGSFFTGILATLVATPCTAPFMASAVGAALTMPPWAAMLVFLSLGFGLALPFLLISIFPSTLRFLPKQGAWMVRFKEFLAFPMYGSVIWLLWVLGLQAGIGAVALVLIGLLLLVFALWLQNLRFLAIIAAALFAVFSLTIISPQPTKTEGIAYSKQALESLRAEGKPVFVDATAAWCITCQVNKKLVLDSAEVQAAFKEKNIVFMVADWTNRNAEITAFLQAFGYNGVPLNVFYPAGGEPIVLPQILSKETVITTITQ